MMMHSVELYRQLGGGEFDPGWVECGGIRLACTDERWEETRRQVGWAKTFGLPLELISRRGGAGEVPADGDRQGDRRLVAAHRRLPGPEPAHLCARRRRAQRRLRRSSPTPVSPPSTPRTARSPASAPNAATSSARSSSTPPACSRPRSVAWPASDPDHPDGPRVRRHAAVPRARRAHRDDARPRPPRLLPRGGRRAWWGGYERASAPWFLDDGAGSTASRPTSTAACSRRTGTTSRRSSASPRARAGNHGRHGHPADQRAGGVHARTASSASARPRSRGLFVAAGFCAHGLAGAGGIGKVMAEWIAEGEP